MPSPAMSITAQIPDAHADASPLAGQKLPSAPVPWPMHWRNPPGWTPSMTTFGVHASPGAQSAVEAHSLQNVSGNTPPVSISCSQVRPGAHPAADGVHITPNSPPVQAAASVAGFKEQVPTPSV